MSVDMRGRPILLRTSLTDVALRRDGGKKRHSDGGLGEGDSEVVVLPEVVVVVLDEAVDGLLHRAHLDQGHLVVIPVGGTAGHFSSLRGERARGGRRGAATHLLKELEGLDRGSGAGKESLQVILHHRGPEGRGETQSS